MEVVASWLKMTPDSIIPLFSFCSFSKINSPVFLVGVPYVIIVVVIGYLVEADLCKKSAPL